MDDNTVVNEWTIEHFQNELNESKRKTDDIDDNIVVNERKPKIFKD